MLDIALVIISSVLTLVCPIPYIIDIIKGNTKPRVVSWLVWSVLGGISFIASLAEHQYPTAALLLCMTIADMIVVVLGWKNGDRKISKIDLTCLAGATIGIILWITFNSPSFAVVVMILTDFIGGVPTLVHVWNKPHEETVATFAISFVAAVLTMTTIKDWRITAFAYPLFIVIITFVYVVVITLRRLVLKQRNATSSVSL